MKYSIGHTLYIRHAGQTRLGKVTNISSCVVSRYTLWTVKLRGGFTVEVHGGEIVGRP